ncbi:MAG: hypothetical protein RIE86_23390 [Imperialibacter sp.]|uniref:hypothetical protein n=1 Tax=Imperialibacter sp. TaxID=2038411 RepID=UPI0032EF271E
MSSQPIGMIHETNIQDGRYCPFLSQENGEKVDVPGNMIDLPSPLSESRLKAYIKPFKKTVTFIKGNANDRLNGLWKVPPNFIEKNLDAEVTFSPLSLKENDLHPSVI